MTAPLNDHIHYQDHQLHIESLPLSIIADRVGTPFYCYSEAKLLQNIHRCQSAFQRFDIAVHYAVKANSNLSILRLVQQAGLGVDLVSGGEILRAQTAGIAPDRMIFSGVGKTRQELCTAIESGVGQINVESQEELALLASLSEQFARPVAVALRVNPDVSVDTHRHITTGSKGNKFGLGLEQVVPLYQRYADHPYLHITGLAMHIGSQICSVEPYQNAIQKLLDLVEVIEADGHTVEVLDLGGGFGINYGDDQSLDFEVVAQTIASSVAGFEGRVCVEPGRSLVGDAGVLVSEISYVKQADPRPFVILDAAMNDLMRPALYQAAHPIVPLQVNLSESERHYDVVGPVCESTDTFSRDYPMDAELAAGDRVAFLCTGAYCAVMSSAYNSRNIIPEVLVSGSEVRLIRQAVTPLMLLEYESQADALDGLGV